MRIRRLSLTLLGAALALPCWALAAPHATLKQAVDAAWQRVPDARTIEARQTEAAAARATAGSWLATPPTLGLSQRRDESGSERDQRESEISVSSSFWLPGQKSARETLAARSTAEAAAHLGATRLAVAGLVRDRMWEAAAAQVTLDEKQDHLHHLEGLAHEVRRRVAAGDLARSDGLLADQEVLAARIEVGKARTAATEALARFQVLTGLPELPALEPEPEPLREGDAPANPRLLAAQASEQRALAALRLAEANRSAPPTIALSVRREDERTLREPARSVGLALQIPFGSAARNRHVEAQAQTAIATAAAQAAEARAAGGADLAVARARLANAKTALEDALARAKALHEHTDLFENAFRQGERGLADLLRSRALTHEADVAVAQQTVAVGHAHAQLNQALGILP